MSSTWRAAGRAQARVYWDGDIGGVVYDQASGDTHFLDALAYELLEMADHAPLNAATGARQLFGEANDPVEAEFRVLGALRRLQVLGLLVDQADT